jgi:hypothetical protein
MYEANSKKHPDLVYVFDEFRLSGEQIATRPRLELENRGRVIETLEVSLEIPTADIKLIDILKDCDKYLVTLFTEKGDYDKAICYIKSVLSEEALKKNFNSGVYVYKLDTSK